jgi:hypothetical protein
MVCEGKCSKLIDVFADEMLQDVRMAATRKLHCSVVWIAKVRNGPIANGEEWSDTMDACNCAEAMDLAFANKFEIYARYALS